MKSSAVNFPNTCDQDCRSDSDSLGQFRFHLSTLDFDGLLSRRMIERKPLVPVVCAFQMTVTDYLHQFNCSSVLSEMSCTHC